jgi:D-amino peptidase
MRVLIVTDLEGVSGIIDWDKHESRSPQDVWQRELMTGEVNAAVEGAFAAGATEVKIAEGHNAIDIRLLDERATLVPAYYPAAPPLQDWEGCDALVEVGKHAMAGTPDGMLAHTGNKSVEFVEINGIRVGESGTEAMEAGDYGFPMVMIAGDHAACREMQELLGDIEVAPVKVGYGPHHGECLPPKRARRLIREKTRVALKRLDDFRPYKVPGPIEYVQRLYQPFSEDALRAFERNPFASIVDDRTVCFTGQNVVEAFARRCGLDYTWPGD